MTSKERIHTTTSHRLPDRVPYNVRLSAGLEKNVASRIDSLGMRPSWPREDIAYAALQYAARKNLTLDHFPLPDESEIVAYRELVAAKQREGYVVANAYTGGVYEFIKHFRGDEYALTAMYLDPGQLRRELDSIFEWLYRLHEINAASGVDICWLGDDLGTQSSLIMSIDNYEEFYRPYHRELIAMIHRTNPDALVAFHSCGYIVPLVPSFIEIGVDILESVQPEANTDLGSLKRLYGSDITFWGAIGTQQLFYQDNTQAVVDEVRRTMSIMARGGGYIASPCHRLGDEAVTDCVIAYFEAMLEYGNYEINPELSSS